MSDETTLEVGEAQDFEVFDIAPEESENTDVQNLDAPAEQSQEATPSGEAPKGEAPQAGEEAQKGEATSDPVDDLTSLRTQLAEAHAELLKYKSAASVTPQPTQPQAQVAPASQALTQPQPAFEIPKTASEVTTVDFLGTEDHVALLESPEKFNALLNKVATVAFNAAVTASQERILRQIPAVVESAANQQMQIRDIVGNFYNANKDLEIYKPAVSMAAIKLHNDNPAMPLEELLAKAAEATRQSLRLRPATGPRQRKPAQPVGTGRVGGDRTATPPTLSDQEQQMLAMLADL